MVFSGISRHQEGGRSPWLFFLLVFLLTIPVYLLQLEAPYSIVMVVNPFIAAILLTYREQGMSGVLLLLKRPLDLWQIPDKAWLLPILFLMPFVMVVEAGLTILAGNPLIGMQTPLLMLPVYFVVFILLAIGEETGWSGYATEPLQGRYGALSASIMIGAVWALWHLIPYLLANSPVWAAGQCATTVLLRILMVWLFYNTGRSVFGMVLFHTVINMATVPDFGVRYDPVLTSVILAGIVIIVVMLWDAKTLSRFRYARKTGPDLLSRGQ